MFEEVPKTDSRWRLFVWPVCGDLEGAQEAITFGYWCSFGVAFVTTVAAALGVMGVKRDSLVGAAVFAAVGFGIWRKWRSAAIVGFLIFASNFVLTMMRSPRLPGVLDILLFFGLLGAVRGTFAYRRLLSAEPAKGTGPQQTDQTT